MGLLTGYIGGLVRWDALRDTDDNASTAPVVAPYIIPFQSTIENVTLNYSGNLQESKTFNNRGIKVSTAACLTEVSATIEFTTTNITFGFLQTAAATLAEDASGGIYVSDTAVVPSNGEIILSFNPVANTAVCADVDGKIYNGTVTAATTTNPAKFTVNDPASNPRPVGKRVTVSYMKSVSSTNPERVIRVGSGNPLPIVGVYGRFFSCEDSYTFMANKVIIVPNMNISVGENPAEIGFTGTILADETDTLFTLVKEPLT